MKIRKLLITLTIILIAMCFFGCSTNKYQKNYDLGIKYLEQGDYENAIISLNAALEIEPKKETYIMLANAYAQLGDYEKSQNMCAQILETYGPNDFKLKPGYISYSDMTEDEQRTIDTTVNAVINGDMDALFDLLEPKEEVWSLYTLWNEYKIYISYGYSTSVHDNITTISPRINIEIRPENGTGYYCYVDSESNETNPNRDSTNHLYNYRITTCPCLNWQWNGECITNGKIQLVDSGEDFYSEYYTDVNETGMMNNNVRDGLFIRTEHSYSSYVSNYYSNSEDNTNTYETTYDKGLIINENGEIPNEKRFAIDISGANAAYDDPYNLLYW